MSLSGSIGISKEMALDSMCRFYTEKGPENQIESPPFAPCRVVASLMNVATQGGSEATVSVEPAIGSPIYVVMTLQIKGLGVETIGPITTFMKDHLMPTLSEEEQPYTCSAPLNLWTVR